MIENITDNFVILLNFNLSFMWLRVITEICGNSYIHNWET